MFRLEKEKEKTRKAKKQKSREAKKQGKAEKQKAGNQKPKKKYQNGKQIIPSKKPNDIIDLTRYSVICLILSESRKKSPRIPSLSASSFPGAAVALLCLKL